MVWAIEQTQKRERKLFLVFFFIFVNFYDFQIFLGF